MSYKLLAFSLLSLSVSAKVIHSDDFSKYVNYEITDAGLKLNFPHNGSDLRLSGRAGMVGVYDFKQFGGANTHIARARYKATGYTFKDSRVVHDLGHRKGGLDTNSSPTDFRMSYNTNAEDGTKLGMRLHLGVLFEMLENETINAVDLLSKHNAIYYGNYEIGYMPHLFVDEMEEYQTNDFTTGLVPPTRRQQIRYTLDLNNLGNLGISISKSKSRFLSSNNLANCRTYSNHSRTARERKVSFHPTYPDISLKHNLNVGDHKFNLRAHLSHLRVKNGEGRHLGKFLWALGASTHLQWGNHKLGLQYNYGRGALGNLNQYLAGNTTVVHYEEDNNSNVINFEMRSICSSMFSTAYSYDYSDKLNFGIGVSYYITNPPQKIMYRNSVTSDMFHVADNRFKKDFRYAFKNLRIVSLSSTYKINDQLRLRFEFTDQRKQSVNHWEIGRRSAGIRRASFSMIYGY